MWKIERLLFTAVYVALALVTTARCDTVVNGEVRGHWTRVGSPYIVNGDISLAREDSLMIDPGVTVRFGSGTR